MKNHGKQRKRLQNIRAKATVSPISTDLFCISWFICVTFSYLCDNRYRRSFPHKLDQSHSTSTDWWPYFMRLMWIKCPSPPIFWCRSRIWCVSNTWHLCRAKVMWWTDRLDYNAMLPWISSQWYVSSHLIRREYCGIDTYDFLCISGWQTSGIQCTTIPIRFHVDCCSNFVKFWSENKWNECPGRV